MSKHLQEPWFALQARAGYSRAPPAEFLLPGMGLRWQGGDAYAIAVGLWPPNELPTNLSIPRATIR
eukprot:scaffold210301_cov32-Tisochrysis_lutea.AAC.2